MLIQVGGTASKVSGTILPVGPRTELEGRKRAERQHFSLSASSVQVQCDQRNLRMLSVTAYKSGARA